MASRPMILAYVEKILEEFLETDNVVVDRDGDVPIRTGSALYYVRVTPYEPFRVIVMSWVLSGVEESLELYRELNDINANTFGIQAYLHEGKVIFSTDLYAATLQAEDLAKACERISSYADKYDDELQAKFGGEKAFDGDADEESVDV